MVPELVRLLPLVVEVGSQEDLSIFLNFEHTQDRVSRVLILCWMHCQVVWPHMSQYPLKQIESERITI
jgi:hypothetical protein